MQYNRFSAFAAGLFLLLSGFRGPGKPPARTAYADIIYIGGRILTIDSANSLAEALAVKDGRIEAVGQAAVVRKLKGPATRVIDLRGKTLLPGFIDGHSHIMEFDPGAYVNLGSPPMGPIKDIPGIVAALRQFKEVHHIKPGEWINGYGYDQDQLAEKRHPQKEDLDAAFPDNPVGITNINGHMLVVNSFALRISGIDSSTANPPGGFIVRKPGTREPTGLLQEHASYLLKIAPVKEKTLPERLAGLKQKEEYYASFGVTTAQDGYSSLASVDLLEKAADSNLLIIDIDALPGYPILDKLLANPYYSFNTYKNHLKLAGFKLISDGSPQGRTAFFTEPYTTQLPGDTAGYRGFPNFTQLQLNEAVIKGFRNHVQVYVHCNGDAAIDRYIRAVENADSVLGTSSLDRRPVVIHAQFTRPDQLDKYKELGFLPSFFTNHTFFWGDVHIRNLGKDRAFFSSPVKAALDKQIVFTNHSDFPVTPINPLFILWSSVNRESRSGVTIGPGQRLTPQEGLRALTINGAYEYFEEKSKGSLEKGKLADLVILSDDPTTTDPEKIKDIKVLETIKEGKTVYKRS